MECKERESDWYDQAYESQLRKKGEYSLRPESSKYYKLWMKAIEWIPEGSRIIDYGCGVGQFAQLCVYLGKNYVYGCDFSQVAIEAARERNPSLAFALRVKDLREKSSFSFVYYDVAVLLEVLEHVDFDLDIISNILPGKRVIFSVPNYLCGSHVRCFSEPTEVHSRYGDLLEITNVAKFKISSAGKNIWLFDSIKK